MENYLISEAIGDIAGSAYEGKMHRILPEDARCLGLSGYEETARVDGGSQ